MSEKPTHPYDGGQAEANQRAFSEKLRRFTKGPAGPLEVLVMSLGRELHSRERPGADWLSLETGTESWYGVEAGTVTDYCARACDTRGVSWSWVVEAIKIERISPHVIRF